MTDVVADLRARMGRVGIWTGALDGLPVAEATAMPM